MLPKQSLLVIFLVQYARTKDWGLVFLLDRLQPVQEWPRRAASVLV